jgi:hypothetical protein
VTRIADLYADLRKRTSIEWTLSLPGRLLSVSSGSSELATAACRALTVWRTPVVETRSKPDDVCVVENYSRAGFDVDAVGRLPSRSYQHATMGTFHTFELEDGAAVVQPGRSAFLCSDTGEMVWLVEDDLLAGDQERWPNLIDLAMVLTSESLRRGGFFLAHAGGVGRHGRCLLLLGESGAGKTTLALRKAIEGWDFYGDDMVIVGRDGDGLWRVHPYWRLVHLTPQTLAMLGDLSVPSPKFTADNKMQCDITELAPVRPPRPALLEAVLCLQPGWLPLVPERLSSNDAMPALGAAFLSGFNLRNADLDLENLLDLTTATPVYQGSWSTDSQAIDVLFQDLDNHAQEPQIQ